MPGLWEAGAQVTPSVNVNLRYNPRDPHDGEAQVLIPCPVPRSAPFTVALGRCVCGGHIGRGPPAIIDRRSSTCPARPVRVSCSISGKTWEESEVTDAERAPYPPVYLPEDWETFRAACRARWGLVKALVLGYTAWDYTMSSALAVPLATITAMLAQRDAVYAALADMARAEDAQVAARAALRKALDMSPGRALAPDLRESAIEMGSYVEHLVEQVGVLP